MWYIDDTDGRLRDPRWKEADKEFEKVRARYSKYGAWDSEPRRIFESLVFEVLEGNRALVPTTGGGWELFTSSMNCDEAASALALEARKALRVLATIGSGAIVN